MVTLHTDGIASRQNVGYAVDSRHKNQLGNMNVARVALTEPIYRGQGDQKIK